MSTYISASGCFTPWNLPIGSPNWMRVLGVLDGQRERGFGGADHLGRDRDRAAVEQARERRPRRRGAPSTALAGTRDAVERERPMRLVCRSRAGLDRDAGRAALDHARAESPRRLRRAERDHEQVRGAGVGDERLLAVSTKPPAVAACRAARCRAASSRRSPRAARACRSAVPPASRGSQRACCASLPPSSDRRRAASIVESERRGQQRPARLLEQRPRGRPSRGPRRRAPRARAARASRARPCCARARAIAALASP